MGSDLFRVFLFGLIFSALFFHPLLFDHHFNLLRSEPVGDSGLSVEMCPYPLIHCACMKAAMWPSLHTALWFEVSAVQGLRRKQDDKIMNMDCDHSLEE